MKILNFGSLNIDYVYQLERFVAPGETLACDNFEKHYGGKGLNQSVALALAGAEVYHAGRIGTDGTHLVEFLASKGVNTDYITVSEKTTTGHAFIQVNKEGENCIILQGGANRKLRKSDIINTLLSFSSKDLLLIQNEVNNLEAIINTAADMGMYIIMNPSPITEELLKLPLHRIKLFILNKHEAQQLSGGKREGTIIKGLAKRFPESQFVITLGAKGSLYYDPKTEELIEVEADEIENPIDTTGAGDTFLGYFMAAKMKDRSTKRALKEGNYAAGVSITKRGAAEAIPKIDFSEDK